MSWWRKSIFHLLSLLLLVALVGLAVSSSTNLTLSSSAKVEKLLDQSKLYDGFASYATEQAQKSASNEGADAALQQDPTIKDAAATVFSPQLLRQVSNQVLDANYAWLQGKTAQPNFAVNLAGQKQSFAQQVGAYVQGRIATLPVCTPQQLALLPDPSNIDLLSLDCRPATLSPAAAGATVTQQIASSGEFLSNPVVTAQSISKKSNIDNGQPYYLKLSNLPKVYQLGQKLPLISAVVAVLSVLGLIFINSERRRGLRRTGFVLIIAAVLLALSKFVSDAAFNEIDKKAFNQSSIGPLQHSLIDFMHLVQHRMVKIDLYFVLAYLVIAAGIFLAIRRPTPAPAAAPAGQSQARRLGLVPDQKTAATDSSQSKPTGPPPLNKKIQ